MSRRNLVRRTWRLHTALHEAGHLYVALIIAPLDFGRISFVRGSATRHKYLLDGEAHLSFDRELTAFEDLCVLYAGRIGERLIRVILPEDSADLDGQRAARIRVPECVKARAKLWARGIILNGSGTVRKYAAWMMRDGYGQVRGPRYWKPTPKKRHKNKSKKKLRY
jgi:hypothetical protein